MSSAQVHRDTDEVEVNVRVGYGLLGPASLCMDLEYWADVAGR